MVRSPRRREPNVKELVKKNLRPIWFSPFGNKIRSVIYPVNNEIYKIKGDFFYKRENMKGFPRLKRQFKERTGYELDLDNPLTFNQKINWKKIHDRNPLLPMVADKFKVRDYLQNVLGTSEAENILIPLLYVTNIPETIPFDDLPEEYIIKANHGSGTNIIIEKGIPVNREYVIDRCKNWLNKPYGLFKHEWAYQRIDRKIVIEKLIRDKKGALPEDYKFHIFHGKCFLIQVDYDRFSDHSRTLYTRDWKYLPITLKFKQGMDIKRPKNFDYMLGLAEKLGGGFDYIRVDLYEVDRKVYFGELTNYPGSGYERFNPESFDNEIGSKWKLTSRYWMKH